MELAVKSHTAPLAILRGLIYIIVACGLWTAAYDCYAGCIAINANAKRTVIDKPGQYCLRTDLWVDGSHQPWRWDGPTWFSDDSVVIELDSSDVGIDLQGHSVGSDALLVAAITTRSQGQDAKPVDGAGRSPPVKHISLSNGVINPVRGNRAVLIADIEPLENVLSDLVEAYPARAADKARSMLDEESDKETWKTLISSRFVSRSTDYPVRHLILQNLKIKSTMPTVVLQGANSVIRDSVIETESGTALQIHGPNALIENNTFIVHCTKSDFKSSNRSQCLSADAPIRLIHADGAIIRNNRFVLKDGAHKRVISVFETNAFVFEGNVITGLDNLTQTSIAFSGQNKMLQRNNRIDNSLPARIKTWF